MFKRQIQEEYLFRRYEMLYVIRELFAGFQFQGFKGVVK